MGANNEIGSINDVKSIGKICKKYNIPFHTDYVQLFGKHRVDLSDGLISSLSVSFHKLYGPLGIGLLIIDKKVMDKYNLCGLNATMDPLRGVKIGTPAVPLIAGAIVAMKDNFIKRSIKDKHLLKLRNYILDNLSSHISLFYYDDFITKKIKTIPKICIMLFGPHKQDLEKYMHNTILLSVVTCDVQFCNVMLKKYLEKNNVIVSIGSACHTHSKNASHVIRSLNTPPMIRRGVLRISLIDSNTSAEINKFIKIFLDGIKQQVKL
jgi:cysteine desulfurase